MRRDPSHSLPEKEEITLKSLIISGRSLVRDIVKKWFIVLLFCLIALGIQVVQFLNSGTSYTAELTFMVNEDQVQQIPSIGGVLGQFGINPVASDYNLDRILDLLRSRRITESTLLNQVQINNRNDFLANHLIEHLDSTGQWHQFSWYQKWSNSGSRVAEKEFRFAASSLDYHNEQENLALKELYRKLIGDPKEKQRDAMLHPDYNEYSGIMKISVRTGTPELSIALASRYFEELSEFYIEKSIEKQKKTYEIIKNKHDSVFQELRTAEFNLASFMDRSKSTFSYTSQLEETRLKNKITILTAGLAEATKNLEMSDFALQNKTPFIQLIDFPIGPLEKDSKSFLQSIITSLIFALILSVIWIAVGRLVRNALH